MPLDLTTPQRVAIDQVPAEKLRLLVSMAAHGRPLQSIAKALHLPLPVVTTIAIEHGHPHLGRLAEASERLTDYDQAPQTPPAPETALSDAAPPAAGAGEGVPVPILAGIPSAPDPDELDQDPAADDSDLDEAEHVGALLDDLTSADDPDCATIAPAIVASPGHVIIDEFQAFDGNALKFFGLSAGGVAAVSAAADEVTPSEILEAAISTGDQELADAAGRIVDLLEQLRDDTARWRDRSVRLVQLHAELAEARDRVAALEAELDGLTPAGRAPRRPPDPQLPSPPPGPGEGAAGLCRVPAGLHPEAARPTVLLTRLPQGESQERS